MPTPWAGRAGEGRGLERAAYYWDMLTHPMVSPGGGRGVRLTALLVLSQVMSTLGYAGASRKG